MKILTMLKKVYNNAEHVIQLSLNLDFSEVVKEVDSTENENEGMWKFNDIYCKSVLSVQLIASGISS